MASTLIKDRIISGCKIAKLRTPITHGVGIWWGNNNGLSSDYNEILNCKIHHIGRRGGDGIPNQPFGYGRGHGIYMTTSNNIIRGNTFYDVGEYSIHQWTASPSSLTIISLRAT